MVQMRAAAPASDSPGWVASWGLAASVAAAVLSYLLQLAVGRFMSPESYSETLSLLSVYMMILMPAAPFLLVVTKRVVDESGHGQPADAGAFVRGLTARISVWGGAALAAAWLVREPLAEWLMVGPAALPLFALSVVTSLLYSVAQAALLGRLRWRVAIGLPVVLGVARLLLSMLFVWAGQGAAGIFAAIALSTTACFMGAYVLALRGLPPAGRYRPLGIGEIATAASLNGAFWFLVHVDTVYVNRELPQLADQGYAAAAVLARPMVYFAAGVNQALFPFLAAAAPGAERTRVLTRMVAAAVLLGAAGLVILSTAPAWLLDLSFGPAYAGASGLLKTVAWMLAPFALLSVILFDALARHDRVVARWFVAVALAAGILLVVLAPALNGLAAVLTGSAAVATVVGARRMRPAATMARPT